MVYRDYCKYDAPARLVLSPTNHAVSNILFTGFPGFLGSELLPRVLSRSAENMALCLVQPKFLSAARQRAAAIVSARPQLANRISLIEGDITVQGLGLRGERRDISEIYHLAAAYDLAVPRDVAMRVNVQGTRNVLELAKDQSVFQRLHYVSTCYVSGRFAGVFRESDLEAGQTFNNFYEETKYLAEVDVQATMRAGLPMTIYRPAIVVGDSVTGVTQKFDGPYFMMQWLMRQPRLAILPVMWPSSRYHFNVVPSDFVVKAIEYLSSLSTSASQVYQLADPNPLTVDELITAVAAATGRTVLRIPMTASLAKAAIDHVPGVYRVMRIPSAAVDYMIHPTTYDTTNAERDLAPAGIRVPPLRDYLPRLVDFLRAHPDLGSKAMV